LRPARAVGSRTQGISASALSSLVGLGGSASAKAVSGPRSSSSSVVLLLFFPVFFPRFSSQRRGAAAALVVSGEFVAAAAAAVRVARNVAKLSGLIDLAAIFILFIFFIPEKKNTVRCVNQNVCCKDFFYHYYYYRYYYVLWDPSAFLSRTKKKGGSADFFFFFHFTFTGFASTSRTFESVDISYIHLVTLVQYMC
jgi:hypothetical protein